MLQVSWLDAGSAMTSELDLACRFYCMVLSDVSQGNLAKKKKGTVIKYAPLSEGT
jgi:hypothetical protein